MLVEIPDAAIQDAPLSPAELRLELAIWLYAKKRLTLGQARKLAGLSVVDFQKALATSEVYLNYNQEDLADDIAAAHTMP
jgi:predicted HTH domain antitoxin